MQTKSITFSNRERFFLTNMLLQLGEEKPGRQGRVVSDDDARSSRRVKRALALDQIEKTGNMIALACQITGKSEDFFDDPVKDTSDEKAWREKLRDHRKAVADVVEAVSEQSSEFTLIADDLRWLRSKLVALGPAPGDIDIYVDVTDRLSDALESPKLVAVPAQE